MCAIITDITDVKEAIRGLLKVNKFARTSPSSILIALNCFQFHSTIVFFVYFYSA